MKNEMKKGAILGYINILATLLVGLVYTPIMLKLIGQAEYGLYSLVISITAYLSVLDMGFGNAMVRYISQCQAKNDGQNEAKLNGLFLIIYSIIGIITLIIGIIIFLNINNLFTTSLTIEELRKAKIIMIVLIGTIAVSFPLSIYDSYALASEKFVFLRTLNILKTILVPLTMLPLLLSGFKSITMVIITCVFNILYHVCTLLYDYKKLSMKITFSFTASEKKLFKEISTYSFFIFLNLIVDSVFNNTDQIILGSLCGTIVVSIYSVGAKIFQMNTAISTTISGMFLPKVTKILQDDNGNKKVSNMFLKVSRIQLYIMLLILTGFIIFGKNFIILWAGKEYVDAYYIILLLIGPAIIPLTQNVCISIIQAKNRHQFRSIVYIIIAILNICISIPLARKYGGIGAAIGTTIANLIGQILIMNIYYYKKINIDIPSYWKNFLKFSSIPTILCYLFYILNNKINITSWSYTIGGIIIYSLVYFIWCYIYMNEEEKKYVKAIANKVNLIRR